MFIVHFCDQHNYEFYMTLHSTRAAAEAAYEALLRRFVIEGELPPKATWGALCDDCGEGVHIYEIELDGKHAKRISLSDLATA
jgi:hypothetical protein